MKLLLFCKKKLKLESGFSLIEIIVAISISMFILSVFINLSIELYQDHDFFNLVNAWQIDLYLAADFIAEQISNSVKVEIINQNQIEIFTFYEQKYQWLKFSLYQSQGKKSLGRSIGSDNLEIKDFGRRHSLLANISNLKFEIITEKLILMQITAELDDQKIVVSKIINI